jgi:PAS domain S-box-containing protein
MVARKIAGRHSIARTGIRRSRAGKKGRAATARPRDTKTQKQTERVLKALEASYRQFPESTMEGIASVDMGGRMKDFNSAFANMLGYDPVELRTLTHKELTPEQWHAMESDIIEGQVLARGYSDVYEKEYRKKDGTTIPVELRMVLLRDGKNRPSGMWTLIRDITARKQVEEHLRLTEEKFTKAFHLSPDAVNINRMSDGVYLAINEGFTRTTGYTSDDVLHRSSLPGDLGLWVSQVDREKLVAGLKEHGQVEELEAEFRMKNGNVRTGVMSARIIQLDNEPCILSVTRDITERKRANEALRMSEEKYRHLIETMPDGVYKSTHEGRFLDVNPAMVKILGYDSREELLAIDIPSELYFAASDRESAALEEKLEEMAVFRLRKKDGSRVWVEDHGRHVLDDQGNVLYHEGILRDVTERTRGEELLRASEERMRAIIEGTPQLFFYTQDAQANTTYVSPTVTSITGYEPDVWLKKKDWFITDAEVNRIAIQATQAHLRGEVSEGPLQVEVQHRAGHPILLEVYEHPVLRNGKVVGLQGVAHDITERKHAEEAIVRSLREKEVLLKEVHHRVKNNLQIISSMLNMQASEVADDTVSTALNEAQSRVRSMALVHERLYGVTDFANIDLFEYAQSLTSNLAQTWMRPGIDVDVQGGQTPVGVDIAIPCGLILNELVTNAFKHAFAGRERGRVVVTVQRRAGEEVEMSVRDDGIGFPPGKDFNAMVSMGMNLVVNLVEQLSGTIALERTNGSSFVILFRP